MITEKYIRRSIITRVWLAFLPVVVLAVGVMWRIGTLQWQEGEKWAKLAVGLQTREVIATRGSIYSDDGSLLATSLPFYRLSLDPTIAEDTLFVQGLDSLSQKLENFFGEKTAAEYAKTLENARAQNRQYVPISRRWLDYQERKVVANFPILREGRHKGGAIWEKVDRRFRPYPELARRTVGFINEQDTTVELAGRGLEYSFNSVLEGVKGEALFQRIAGGYWIPIEDVSQVQPKSGLSLQTTLDLNLQDTIHGVLEETLQKFKANYGTVILMEVATGEIKAMVNLGRTSDSTYAENNNYAVGQIGLAEPGSTFKLMTMAALLEEAHVKLDDTVQTGRGTYKFFDDAIMRDVAPYGKLSVREVFEKSSNIGTSKLVYKFFRKNPQKFIQHLESFGVTKPLGFQMQGEAVPYIKDTTDASWSGSSLPWMSIGYELKLSPLHTLAFYNAVANGGKMIEPIIVKRTMHANKTVEDFKPRVLNPKICSDETLEKLHELLRGVVEHGTARNIRKCEVPLAGKTGTAEKVRDGRYTEDHYTSFAGFFPADNPKYTCIVVIDNPKDDEDRYGSQVCGPVFQRVAEITNRRKLLKSFDEVEAVEESPLPYIRAGYAEDLQTLCKTLGIKQLEKSEDEWVRTGTQGDTVLWYSNGTQPGLVPNVQGMRLRDALFLLENAGLEVQIKGMGRVKQQSIAPGTAARKGSRVVLLLED